ncbi:MAG: NFACT family protein, partial [Thermoplasmata archaeon]
MKNSLSGLDLVAIERELQALVGSRIDKVYQPDKDRIVISISSKAEGRTRLNVLLPGWIWLGGATEEMPSAPSGFASQLRRHVSNARIMAIEQHGLDRIIEFKLKKETDMRLIIELFGDGNIVLVGSDGRIIALMRSRKWKQRDLRPKSEYKYPPAAFDPRKDGKTR